MGAAMLQCDCLRCGAAITATKPGQIVCSVCGWKLGDDKKSCETCQYSNERDCGHKSHCHGCFRLCKLDNWKPRQSGEQG